MNINLGLIADHVQIGIVIPGCTIDPQYVSPIQAIILETMSCFALQFLAVGIGLDPRQGQIYGPALAPILIGFAAMYCTFASAFLKEGYYGACELPSILMHTFDCA
jgi:glycerol uptake facilitator-like aquaporin